MEKGLFFDRAAQVLSLHKVTVSHIAPEQSPIFLSFLTNDNPTKWLIRKQQTSVKMLEALIKNDTRIVLLVQTRATIFFLILDPRGMVSGIS